MQIFTPCLNPITGEREWNLQNEDYDFNQEIARSSYADMLHDKERNDLYFEGIRRSVAFLKNQNKEVHVLDIGTGTGLLSMMAISCGVDSVTACEVNLIERRSTEIECGEGKEMPHRANLLIAEVFDTELIGEGAIETFMHAKEHLLTPDALVVPMKATIYVQVISSDLIRRWNKLTPIRNDSSSSEANQILLNIPDTVENCPGAAAVHDIQLSEITRDSFTAISNPIPVFEFDWSGRDIPLLKERSSKKSFSAEHSGRCDAVFMWWDLKMDPLEEITLSCAPVWAHPLTKGKSAVNSAAIPWRDHWMQGLYYFPESLTVLESEEIILTSSHDEYSLWFGISKEVSKEPHSRPTCECGVHGTFSRTRLGQLNDPRWRAFYLRVLKKHIRSDTTMFYLGDSSFLAIVAASLGANHVYIQPSTNLAQRIMEDFIQASGVGSKITILPAGVISTSDILSPINFVFSEPFFESSVLPWHALQFFYKLRSIRHLLSHEALVLPQRLVIRAVPVQFRDLWKIRYPLESCAGFKMDYFDKMIERACEETDDPVEPQPLWEYPGIALGGPVTLFDLNIHEDAFKDPLSRVATIPLNHSGTLNALALWADWSFQEESFSTGPVVDVTVGDKVQWDMYTRQGIYLFKHHYRVTLEKSAPPTVEAQTTFNPQGGVLKFGFTLRTRNF